MFKIANTNDIPDYKGTPYRTFILDNYRVEIYDMKPFHKRYSVYVYNHPHRLGVCIADGMDESILKAFKQARARLNISMFNNI